MEAEPVTSRRRPGLTASVFGKYAQCPSAFIREWEMDYFYENHGLPPPAAGAAAEQGNRLHEVMAALPYFSEQWGIGQSYNRFARIVAEVTARGIHLRPGDRWFLYDSLRKRDQVLDELMERAGASEGVVTLTQNFDAGRLFAEVMVDDAPMVISGLPDVLVIAQGPRGVHAAVVDYKTGYLGQAKAAVNAQLRVMAVLASVHVQQQHGTLQSCLVALLQKNDAKPGVIDGVLYGQEDLMRARTWVREVATDRTRWLRAYEATREPDGTPEPLLQEKLEAAATPGHTCSTCNGRMACQKVGQFFQRAPAEDAQGKFLRGKLAEAKHALGEPPMRSLDPETVLTLPPPPPLTMKLETLAATLAWSGAVLDQSALPEKIWTEATELVRQLATHGRTLPEGWALKAGTKQLAVREDMPLLDAEGQPTLDPATGLPATLPVDTHPQAVFDRLRPILPPEARLEDFVRACGEVNAKQVAAYLADTHQVDPKQVYDRVLQPMGWHNPLEMRANKPSVVPMIVPTETAAEAMDKIAGLAAKVTELVAVETPPVPVPKKKAAKPVADLPATTQKTV